MPANKKQQTVQSPTSPTAQATAKYTNKDGSKFITVPKATSATNSPEPSPSMAQTASKTNGQTPFPTQDSNGVPATVNRKKQKRRQKQAEAARLAAEQSGHAQGINGTQLPRQERKPLQTDDYENQYEVAKTHHIFFSDEEGDEYSGSYAQAGSPPNGYDISLPSSKASKRKGKAKAPQKGSNEQPQRTVPIPRRNLSNPPPMPPPLKTGMSKEKIWNTSSQEERERIKLFWLSLGEEDRRSLVKVEKDAVLKKMKEQQKHSCSCTVCGRKRIAIEEELEVLYDAYYEELEQYANNQQGEAPPPMMTTSRRFGPMGGLQPPNRLPPAFNGRQPSRGKIVEHFDNEEYDEIEGDEGDEEYSEDDYLSDDDPVEEIPRSHATDFFNFGQSLTVQGGILTVADDLLKNDGKKFIEMMEQLAERRMAREEDAKEQLYSNGYSHPANGNIPPHNHHGHNHPPTPEDDEYDDEEEEEDDYDSQEDEYDEEEMDTMTEEQRMEEGRRMFQIFAARMFEQRVLTAYKEKVAAERQEKLIQELDEENEAAVQKKAKKAKDAQKKKEKAQQKKLLQAEEKSRREAEKAAEEAALRAADEKKAEEARLKAEEKRKKREAQKKAEEEERARKEAEKQRRLQEQRERQAEVERKQREAKDREKKEKEELRHKERETKEAKEREARERKEKLEREKREAEAKVKAEKTASDQQKRREQNIQQAAVPTYSITQSGRRPNQQISIPTVSSLQTPYGLASPHIQVATPVVPKAPTPSRASVTSQRDVNSVPQTPQVSMSQSTSPNSSAAQQASPGPLGQAGKANAQQPFLHHPQASPPIHAALKGPPPVFTTGPFPGMQPIAINGFAPGMQMIPPGYGGRMHHDPAFPHQQVMGNQFRPPPVIHMHQPMSSVPIQQGRGFPGQHPPPGFSQLPPNATLPGFGPTFVGQKEPGAAQTHSRQQSASFEKPTFDSSAANQPIARPAPIGRPSSVVHGQRLGETSNYEQSDVDDLANHLGSSALLDDADDTLTNAAAGRQPVQVPTNLGRQGFGPNAPFPTEPSAFSAYNSWSDPRNVFGAPPISTHNFNGWGTMSATNYGAVGGGHSRPSQPRSVAVRIMLCKACRNLEGSSSDGFNDISAILEQLERLNPPQDQPVSNVEILELCETEGNPNNGGGYFDVRDEVDGRKFIRYQADALPSQRAVGAPGDIGSPVVGNIGVSRFHGPPGIPMPSAI